MVHVIAHFPDRRGPNLSHHVSMNPGLRGTVVRLEAPVELDGDWSGPVYARLRDEPRFVQGPAALPFDTADAPRAPAWPVTLLFTFVDEDTTYLPLAQREYLDQVRCVPFWRLTHPQVDLSAELIKRPLLSVFRFVRISRYFAATAAEPNVLVQQTSAVHLCGQVLSYHPARASTLLDDIKVVVEPGSDYLCTVAIRSHVGEPRLVVCIPLPEFRRCRISRQEFITGFCHDYPTACAVPDFSSAWSAFRACGPTLDSALTRAHLVRCFASMGASSRCSVDVGQADVTIVQPNGAVTSVNPVLYAQVTTKMLFSVNFFTRPIDHFLSTADGDRYVQDRVVTHDSTQWGGAEPAPTHTISRADQLQRALYVIQDAATQWYTDSVARVFRAVLHDATTNIVPAATPPIINAMMNLYVMVFSTLFANLLAGTDEWELEHIAIRAMRRDSPEYQQYVNHVLNDAMMHAVFRPIGQRQPERPQGPFRPRIQDARRPPPGGAGGQARGTVIPEPVRAQIPPHNGRSVCLRFQVQKGCDFPRCQHSHSLTTLPAAVLSWLVGAHGPLRRDHPHSS